MAEQDGETLFSQKQKMQAKQLKSFHDFRN